MKRLSLKFSELSGLLPAVMLAASVFTAFPAAATQNVDLQSVRASLKLVLDEAASISREEGRHVLPLRTNAELESVSDRCNQILALDDPGQNVPSICGEIDDPAGGFRFKPEFDLVLNNS